MPSLLSPRLVVATLVAALGGWACSNDCPNCPGSTASVKVSPGTTSVLLDRAVQLVALAYDANGALLNRGSATWKSSNDAIATVDDAGLVSGVTEGDATISAKLDGKTATGVVHVVSSSTFSVQVFPILQNSCALAFCHVTPGPPPAMTSVAAAYGSIVTSGTYVVPGDSTQGLLLDRLKGIPRPMPPDGPFKDLQPGNYDLIAAWIAEGALNN
jgi:hypothetical protein